LPLFAASQPRRPWLLERLFAASEYMARSVMFWQ
jgi:hypothetical protein